MRRRVAWTRLSALALAAGLVLHAAMRAPAQLGIGEAAAMAQVAAAILLASGRTRALGVIAGSAVLAVVAMAAVLAGEPGAAAVPLMLIFALLALGRRLDGERQAGPRRNRHRRSDLIRTRLVDRHVS